MNHYRRDIDGLRAIAILPVLFFHAGIPGFTGGFIGVDVFFVISGFLITQLILSDLQTNTFRFTDFWLRRARRILPALFVMMLVTLLISKALLLPHDLKAVGQSVIAQIIFLSNVYFWKTSGYFSAPAETMPLLHTWSLSVEEQFYFIFPLILRFTFQSRFKRMLPLVIVLIFFISLFSSMVMLSRAPVATFFLLPTRAWELLMGSCLAFYLPYAPKKMDASFFHTGLSGCALLAIALPVFLYDQTTPFPGIAALLPCLGTALLIGVHAKTETMVSRLLTSRFLVGIGLLSYSLYLWHWPLFVFIKYSVAQPLSWQQSILIVVGSFILAFLSYRGIETPILRKHFLRTPRYFLISAFILSGLILVLGGSLYLNEGHSLPPNIKESYDAAFYKPPAKCVDLNLEKGIPVCSTAGKNTPDLLLWGDSHALVMRPLIEELAEINHIPFWHYNCKPILNVYSPHESPSLEASKCYQKNLDLVAYLKQHPVKNILLISFWSHYTEGREVFPKGPGQSQPYYADATLKSRTPEEARLVFRRNFIHTIKTLQAAGSTIWIMRQVPSYLYRPPQEFVGVFRQGGDPNKIGRPLSDYLKRQADLTEFFYELEKEGVRILDPIPLLCDEKQFCHAADQGKILYYDFNHVSYAGAVKLRPLFLPFFETIKNKDD